MSTQPTFESKNGIVIELFMLLQKKRLTRAFKFHDFAKCLYGEIMVLSKRRDVVAEEEEVLVKYPCLMKILMCHETLKLDSFQIM